MGSTTSRRALVLAAAAVLGVAMTATTAAAGPVDAPPPDLAVQLKGPAKPVFDRDDAIAAAMRDIPTFGGAYVDRKSSVLHLWLTQPATADVARSRAALAAGTGLAAAGTVVHRVDYTFAQLNTWHDDMATLLSLPGVVMTDLDQRVNRLTLAVADADRTGAAIKAGLAGLGIPLAAVNLVPGEPFRTTVRDQTRPLHAGTQIQFARGASTFNCTLGFPATRSGVNGFVTASHCSTTRSVVDGGRYWQSTRPAGDANPVGTETVDRAFFTSTCPTGRLCRVSDANFVAAQTGVNIALGRIARPPLNSTNWNGTDTFRVVARGGTAVGDPVQKVGRTTGRTSGTVTGDCVDLNVADTNITLFCQETATYQSAGGDSGSPVFEVTNSPAANDVALVGVHWGGGVVDGVNFAAFSELTNVGLEVGTIQVCAAGFSC
ncbi:hypothetical protein [Plantactinospora sp. CA-290183]|uniref:hypothetical protein n=1 Tax=Plantactinospora sp. CA-290183 TaxID=3240006 RepID=UPI003D92F300